MPTFSSHRGASIDNIVADAQNYKNDFKTIIFKKPFLDSLLSEYASVSFLGRKFKVFNQYLKLEIENIQDSNKVKVISVTSEMPPIPDVNANFNIVLSRESYHLLEQSIPLGSVANHADALVMVICKKLFYIRHF